MNKIISITELFGFKVGEKDYSSYDGYKIKTSTKEYTIGVSNGQDCCEEFGVIKSDDDTNDFIGAEVLDVNYVNEADYNECEILKEKVGDYADVFDCAFISIKTDKGLLQFAVYNHHNGYYGHDIIVKEEDSL